ncbi:transmembrane protein 126A [Aulostomus maculatus]
MSENTQKITSAGKQLNRVVIYEMLMENFDRLPEVDQKFFTYGPIYLAGNASLVGLIANSLYRRALNVREAKFTASMPMAVLPFLGSYTLYAAFVSTPLMGGDLNCPICAPMRGALVGVVSGGLYPILLALPVNLGLASRYSTAPMPEKGNVVRHLFDLSRPILKKMRAVLLLQAVFGTYLGNKHFETYRKLISMT